MKKRFLLVFALASAFILAACGDGGDDNRTLFAAQDLTVDANSFTDPAVVKAFKNEVFVFPNGVQEFGTTTPTTVVIQDTATAHTFTITSAQGTASGELEFGTCIFLIKQSTFAPPSPLAVGNRIVIPNCKFEVRTRNTPANDQPFERSVRWLLSNAVSNDTSVEVRINGGGRVTVNGQSIGTVTLSPVTGS